MAIGFEDEFEYLNDDDSNTSDIDFAPKIKGSREKSILPEEETAEELKKEEKEIEEEIQKKAPSRVYNSVIFVVKVTTNKEDKALELISDKVRKKEINIYAIARPHGLRGYIFLEVTRQRTCRRSRFQSTIRQRDYWENVKIRRSKGNA
jgi:hypothetical protein